MPTVAYLANVFPSPLESYVADEIRELRQRGMTVVPCSVRKLKPRGVDPSTADLAAETLYLQPLQFRLAVQAVWLCLRALPSLTDLWSRILFQGREPPLRRARAVAHTWLGAYLALLLGPRGVEHIHVHHGYFASWMAMVAARLLGISFSMTLHGSDLLLHRAYLDTKLRNCRFCLTVSAYNRRYILLHYPEVEPQKLVVQRLGVDPLPLLFPLGRAQYAGGCRIVLAVGRLHPVKDHAFLVRACRRMKDDGLTFLCLIVGEGEERARLEHLIADLDLTAEVRLTGQVSRETLDSYYAMADLVVLTSRSEGIPLTLMEAMAQAKPVLAPAITGIPELVIDGKTGFLYEPGSLEDFVGKLETICQQAGKLERLCRAARRHVLEYFNREKNLAVFGNLFLARLTLAEEKNSYEDTVLQQI